MGRRDWIGVRIRKILKNLTKYKDDSVTVYVQLEDGSEAEIFIGGEVEVWFDHRFNKAKAHVKRAQSRGKPTLKFGHPALGDDFDVADLPPAIIKELIDKHDIEA